jgi:hypothetical protein
MNGAALGCALISIDAGLMGAAARIADGPGSGALTLFIVAVIIAVAAGSALSLGDKP